MYQIYQIIIILIKHLPRIAAETLAEEQYKGN